MVDEGVYCWATGGSRGKRASLRLSRRLSCDSGDVGEEVECEGDRAGGDERVRAKWGKFTIEKK